MTKAVLFRNHAIETSKIFNVVKKYGYLLVLLLSFVPLTTIWLMKNTPFPNAAAYFPFFFIFVVVPILDYVLGKDSYNVDELIDVPKLEKQIYYRALTMLCVPLYFALLVLATQVLHTVELSRVGQLGFIVSIGMFGGMFAINTAHELMHKTTKIEPFLSGVLLSLVCFSGFKIEHIRGHHVNVSTPEDYSSSKFNQSLYNFLWHALRHNTLFAFELEKQRLNKKGLSAWNYRNELIWWHLLSVVWIILTAYFFGTLGVVLFLGQSVVAIVFLEIINYVEHYGLERKRKKSGKYEPVTHVHSWNSNYLLTNLLLFQLQRHSDHHAYPKRRYQILRHHDDSPQLPFGYATMVLIALVPPLWRRIMNPITLKYLGKAK